MKMMRILVGAAALATALAAHAVNFGVDLHTSQDATTNSQVASIMQNRNLKQGRADLFFDQNVAGLRDLATKINAAGGRLEVSLQTQFQWDNSCPQDLAGVESTAYNQATNIVNQTKDVIYDYELLNEPQLRPEIQNEVPWNYQQRNTANYANKPCVASLMAALRGISRAVHDVGAASGLPLRVILGEVGRDWGFLTYASQQGVTWDVTGFHVYPRLEHDTLDVDPWYGTGGALGELARFNKPIHINEFNCGETYDGTFDNEKCLKSVDRHITALRNQTVTTLLESVHYYELADEPSKSAPENRFGLMYNLTQPKSNLYLATANAGGNLTTAEQQEVTSRGLMTDAEIAAIKSNSGDGGTTPPPSGSDTTPPVINFTQPANGATFKRGQKVFVSSTITDNVQVVDVRYYVNGFEWCSGPNEPTDIYACNVYMPNTRGTATIKVQAKDAAGNVSTQTKTVNVVEDTRRRRHWG